ncbi:dTDP-glucose 4,6-dehydratase [Nocardia terpenica]|uniref:dTDP-glucose 4,6-dehydratase n=1 Tax=Nocardia terpenica TaxID=455432 RepID=A0A6G9Z5Y1_9NOCA|nr:dTDP-glucose 4,6-dehydratase [Nocardia terpenica]QIS20413.1 dTDP-glucose 4,6-dehydratase [Nocardia terpenica]
MGYKVLVTGGAGFIGSHFVKRMLAADAGTEVTVLDALTYAGHLDNLGEVASSPRLRVLEGNILDTALVDQLMREHAAVVHLAAESHVDRSFFHAGNFVSTNVLGTQILFDAAMRGGVRKFVHVSTDEVYGPLPTGAASEDAPLAPTVPYAASKAASDIIALSYYRTYGFPVCITRSSNNFGPAQHPEKIVPNFITSLLKDEYIALHGDGGHVRNWLYVEDNCAGIELVLRHGEPGAVYNIGGGTDLTNKQLTQHLLTHLGADWDRVHYVTDRRSNDRRYAMTWDKIAALGYRPRWSFEQALAATVRWYRDNPSRWAPQHRNPAAPLPVIGFDTAAGE